MLYWPRPAAVAAERCRRTPTMGPSMSSPDAGQRFLELLTMMARLRGAVGCPWDREQTRDSLRPFLVEETYEVLDALDTGDPGRIREELGDLLFQVVFHAEIARERGEFSMGDLIEALVTKMTRRHPHVFGDRPVGSAAEALAQWEAIKDSESHGAPRSTLARRPARAARAPARPAGPAQGGARGLRLARSPRGRWRRSGRSWARWSTPCTGVTATRSGTRSETSSFQSSTSPGSRTSIPEGALQATVDRFARRFASMEEAARNEGRDLTALSLDEWERLWSQAKSLERPA